jgi:hypothetical protein
MELPSIPELDGDGGSMFPWNRNAHSHTTWGPNPEWIFTTMKTSHP